MLGRFEDARLMFSPYNAVVNEVWIINGIPGTGKTTVGRLLAGRMKQGVHVEGEVLQNMVVAGSVWPGEEPAEEASRQIHLNYHNMCLLGRSYCEAGFTPVLETVIPMRTNVKQFEMQLVGLTLFLWCWLLLSKKL